MLLMGGISDQSLGIAEFGNHHQVAGIIDITLVTANLKGKQSRNSPYQSFEGRLNSQSGTPLFFGGIATEFPHHYMSDHAHLMVYG